MKKVLLAGLFVLIFSQSAFSATDVLSSTERKVWDKGVQWVRTYTGANVAIGASTVFAIPVKYTEGQILEITFYSASTAWSVLLSSVDGVTTKDENTFLVFSETASTLGSPTITVPRTYYNGDTPAVKYIYATIKPTAVATGVWTLIIKEPMK